MHAMHADEMGLEVQPRWNPEQARAKGEALALAAWVAPRVYDVLKLQRAVKTLCVESSGPAVGRALALESALAPLPKDTCAQVAIGLVCSLRDEQLRALARGSLLLLRDAVSLAEVEAASASLDRLDDELRQRGPLEVHDVDGLTLLAEGVSGETLALAIAQLLQRRTLAQAQAPQPGQWVVLARERDRLADDGLLLAHLKGCAKRALDAQLTKRLEAAPATAELLRLEEEAVLAAAPAVQTPQGAFREWVKGLFMRPKHPEHVPVALRLSIQSR